MIVKDAEDINQFVDRLAYEYKRRDFRNEAARNDLYSYDYQSNQPFFKPRLNPVVNKDKTGVNIDTTVDAIVIDDVIERFNYLDDKRKQQIKLVKQKQLKDKHRLTQKEVASVL